MIKIFTYTFLILAAISAGARAQSGIHSNENILRFADYLFCSKDYLRAYLEYESYLLKINSDTVKYKSALSLQKINRFDESEKSFAGLFGSPLSIEAEAGYYKSVFLSEDYVRFSSEFARANIKDADLHKRLALLNYSAQMLLGELPDEDGFKKLSNAELLNFYNRKKNMPHKSPTAAGIMSAIIPGSGKIYTGEIGDGITSLIATGLFAYLSYDNFTKDRNTRGWIFGGIAGFFYAGNIYGTAQSALIYNAREQVKFEADLLKLLQAAEYFLPEAGFICR
jgi:TM2 domain-containing membrane protein YozV